ncbi:centrosomal protein of 44 kDa isoform X2 [Gymnodraco acuticeps]|uniref:Centrosomal protein of 44 kDa n=1 Tax=Gymnodraco acuticeps TaxID=8218 RepID=A0A6P8UWR6_GYMAC|nr:centrosomal protein of 44 kDa isoform X2 [Gymnodraco acuticeps]
MLSNGDVNACLRKLESLLRTIKYPGHVDYNGLSKGDPSAFLPIVSFTLTSFSPPFANQLMEDGLELTGKTDLRFTDTLYKVLRDIFHYKPILTKQQFLQWGFSVRKISVICDIINLVLQKHNLLKKLQQRVRCPPSHKEDRGEAHPTLTDADTTSKKPVVENHMGNCSISPTSHAEAFSSHIVTHISHNEVHSSTSPREGELAGQGVDNDHLLYSSEVEGRLSALEAQLGSVVCVLDRLSVLEERMEERMEQLMEQRMEQRDQHRNTDKDEEQVITISRESWENLMSRLLLVETKVDLNNIQLSVPPQCPSCPCASNYSSNSMSDASKGDIKDRLDRITNMLKSTSSLLKITESSS